eukprot:6584200-Pyramimonas_sp.AAC.1
MAQKASKTARERPQTPKMAPTRPKRPPRSHKKLPRRPKRPPKSTFSRAPRGKHHGFAVVVRPYLGVSTHSVSRRSTMAQKALKIALNGAQEESHTDHGHVRIQLHVFS